MRALIKKILKDSFTGVDNKTYDLGRILIAIGFVSLLIFQAFEKQFNAFQFAGAIGALLSAGGILLKLKETTEPKKELETKGVEDDKSSDQEPGEDIGNRAQHSGNKKESRYHNRETIIMVKNNRRPFSKDKRDKKNSIDYQAGGLG
jgi:hypothetical protein